MGLTCFDCHISVDPLMAPIRFELEYLDVLSPCCFILNIECTKVGLATDAFHDVLLCPHTWHSQS